MNKSKIFILCLLLCSFSKSILCVRLILFNRTKRKIRIKYMAHGVSEPDAGKKDLLDKDVYVIPNANMKYRISWAYVNRFETQKIMLGRQYRDRDIFLESEDDYLITIVGHGKNRSNYTETLLTKDEATAYVEEISEINKIRDELNQFDQELKKRHSTFFGGGDIFYSHLEASLSEGTREIQKLSSKIKEWLLEIQKSKRALDSKKTKLHGYGEETLQKIIDMDRKLAAFLDGKPEISPASYEYTSMVAILPTQDKNKKDPLEEEGEVAQPPEDQ